ncbi:MAG TPA: hypothetical protein VFI72_08510 [Candidatus Angelobacter sp.]|nr:hypothetical protein [Candidatus Angelobacter sp.]
MKRIISATTISLLLLLCLLAMVESQGTVAVGQVRKTDVRKPDKPSAKRGPVDSDDLKDQQPTKKAAKVFHGETSDQKDAKLATNTVSLAPRKVDSSKKIHLNPPPPKPSNSATSSSASTLAPKQGLTEPKPYRKNNEIKEPQAGAEEPHHSPHNKRPHATGCSSVDSQDLDKCKEAKEAFRKPERKK